MRALAAALLLAGLPSRPVDGPRDFLAPDGGKISLGDRARGRPLAVVVIKGHWCEACRTQLASLSERIEEIRGSGGEIVALSTEDSGTNRAVMKAMGLRFDLLGEPEARLLEELGFWTRGAEHPVPGLFFLDKCGEVAHRYFGRVPGTSQDELVLSTLRRLAAATARCETRT